MENMRNLYKSPKRKRVDLDYNDRSMPSASSSPSRSTMSIADVLSPDEVSVGRNSPQVAVTGQLQSLDIDGSATTEAHARHTCQQTTDAPQTPRRTGRTLKRKSRPNCDNSSTDKSPKKGAKRRQSKSPTPGKSSPIKSPSTPRTMNKSRRKSPPLISQPEENPLTWHDSEITGYDPTDPDDDGYGLNGVGFKPSAAMAWDRVEKRKKQIAEWKAREGREARSKRRERRDGADTAIEQEEAEYRNRKRVRFGSEIPLEVP